MTSPPHKRDLATVTGDMDDPAAKRVRLGDSASSQPGPSTSSDAKGSKRGNGRFNGYKGKRRGRNDDPPAEETLEGAGEDTKSSKPRLPKRRCALLLGFCGTGYNGMQRQVGVPTIEADFFDALVKAGAISEDNADDPVKSQLHRAARTDAGVHAAGNVVSIKMSPDVPGVPDLVAHINGFLPPSIRLWSIVRTTNSFDAKSNCDSRKYTYIFPSHALLPPKPGTPLSAHTACDHAFWAGGDADDMSRKRQWRVPADQVDALRSTLARYKGTHNFHNFTIGKEFKDKTTQRFIRSIEVSEPAVRDGIEWISVLFHGQSFMLHQRKMIGAAVLVTRTSTPPTIIDELYGPQKVHVPQAPALGLLLEYPLFESYNKRVEDAPDRAPIDFEVHRAQLETFKEEKIYSEIREREAEQHVFDKWVRGVDTYVGNDFRWLGPSGKIPQEAVYIRGAKRVDAFKEPKKDTTAAVSDDEAEVAGKDLADMEG
ncbi:pseudouridine synthase [Exidia glandulosa HHB12029]|uniref:tRNA pseudouridine synthase 1 n=1 Tax=Exidia glandulosa HHB12029 TaxID=1314781 RepID=A0A165NV30_EXIGL|nr:pseudouridine synthase [Exidia glandulosa HHB12029]